ncbi:MAG: ribonuclease H-like domain-containing protein [Bryobacter sp.]|nr:ribonuclease H-like domain-containing protein [Bryobacter sp.]
MQPALKAQLDFLRARIAKVDAKFALAPEPLPGMEVETELGRHWELERLYPWDHSHGDFPVSRLTEIAAQPWVYLDTETTGLAGGTGTVAFLIGAGHLDASGFRLRQWFLREPGEEASALLSLSQYLAGFAKLVTYNGRSYDQPLLETRYTLQRQRPPFARLDHDDLLYAARRLWKLRFDSCRLVELERQVLGHERHGDVPGELIPQLYFEFLRTRHPRRLLPVFEHNALDILSLAFLAAILPPVFADPLNCPLGHGAELAGLARWLAREERFDEAVQLYRRAIDAEISDDLLFRSLWELSLLEKRREDFSAALILWTDLSQSRNPFRADAYTELAKYYEHREKNAAMALECTLAALSLATSDELLHRRSRLEAKLNRPRPRRLL